MLRHHCTPERTIDEIRHGSRADAAFDTDTISAAVVGYDIPRAGIVEKRYIRVRSIADLQTTGRYIRKTFPLPNARDSMRLQVHHLHILEQVLCRSPE